MPGRPAATEAAPYYFTYIDQVSGDDAALAIERQLEPALAAFSAISEDQSLARYAPDKWSIRQVLCHLNDAERVFAFRAFWFARGFSHPLPSFDQNDAASLRDADGIAWQTHVEEFRRIRLASIALFAHLPPEAWLRTGVASDRAFSVRALAFILAGHVEHHLRLLREQYR